MLSTQRIIPTIRRAEDYTPVNASLVHIRTDEGRMSTYTYQDKYSTVLKVGNEWFANDAEVRLAREHAEREVGEFLFGDVRSKLHRLRNAIYQRDREEAMRLVNEIDEATKP